MMDTVQAMVNLITSAMIWWEVDIIDHCSTTVHVHASVYVHE